MRPELHIGILPDRPIAEIAELAALAEELGFAGIWIADSQSLFRDAFDALTLCAARTSSLTLATGVTNPRTRHLAALAGSFATIDELSEGRMVLGIGVGESAVRTLGLRPARLAELERATHVLRALLGGEEVEHDGAAIRLTWTKRSIPIVFASSGPRSLELAGRIADGVLFQVGADPALVRYALSHIAVGEAEAGRANGTAKRLVRLACSIDGDRARAREEVRGYAAAAAGTVHANVPKEDMPEGVWEDMRAMKEQYDYFEHASSQARHQELLTDRVVDAIAIAGTPEEALPRFRELAALEIDGFVIPITTPHPEATIRLLASEVMAKL
ncbi:MAG: LLM class flavin-dependent oxidoreductase [Actinobacteria bacterium]|nr:LLM class flavin-dependent oxidoreductase [Actinomycetota bacterium]